MLNKVDLVLQIAISGLEKDLQSSDPKAGVNGHLYFVLEELSRLKLTKKQQKHMEMVLALHKQCMYSIRSMPEQRGAN